jgi:endonuclease/exonuclease/phosphatase family metal-dependent hydrolase
MRALNRLFPLLALAALAACSEQNPVAPQTDISFNNSAGHGEHAVSVMTRNLYIGTDVDAVMAVLGTEAQGPALGAALQTLQHTDFATRIRAIAHEIATNRPDVVGIQEAYDLYVDQAVLGALGLPGSSIQIDFLAQLQAALAREHVRYVVAAKNTGTDASLEGGAVSIVDHDVLLVNARTVRLLGDSIGTTFATNVPTMYLPEGLALLRGYVSRKVSIDGAEMLLVNTHLESGDLFGDVRAGQALELAALISASSAPRVILTGDFNDVQTSEMYGVLAGANLVDTWAALRPRDAGFTCCQTADLSNRRSVLNQRIDYIWTRGFTRPSGKLDGEIQLVSAQPDARVRGAFGLIWPSDHAGLVAELDVPQPSGRH